MIAIHVLYHITVAMYIIGFCDALMDMLRLIMPEFYSISGVPINDIRIIGTVTLVLVLALAIVGMDWVTRVSSQGSYRTRFTHRTARICVLFL